MHLYHRNVHRYMLCFSDLEDVHVANVNSVLELLHPAPHGHLDHLQTGAVYLLDQAEDRGENVGILKTKEIIIMSMPKAWFYVSTD